ncbi:hypothetical protein [Flavobacterium ardleyense]|uniref:hypothetical protein n=1 Tax=Flavobacterium ardleyense TaxID=2038737 RepID=UPI00298CACAB|nr:hypothetical protein [Flavobacterium ardleyense]
MLKRNSEACLHYFIVPFDLSKAELFASRSETIEEREHRKAKMSKRISEGRFHYFIVPFDLSKAELRWEMLFASRAVIIEERDYRKAKMFKRKSDACFHYFSVPFDCYTPLLLLGKFVTSKVEFSIRVEKI